MTIPYFGPILYLIITYDTPAMQDLIVATLTGDNILINGHWETPSHINEQSLKWSK